MEPRDGSCERPQVSFVVLCYNHRKFLRDCIDSILDQEGGYDFEIILVDDASTDQSQSVARSYTDPRIQLVCHERNLGHVATVHDGLSKARGEFIARIDSDDRYRKHYLAKVLDIFSRFPDVALVYGDVALINEDGKVTADRCDRVHGGRDFRGNEYISLLEQNFICAPAVIARRKAWQKAVPVPEGLAFHDWYFTLMIARQYNFYYIDEVLADYRVHSLNLHTQIARDKSEESSIFWLLGFLFNQTEKSPELELQKHKKKRSIYGAHYLTLANKYFGFYMNADARRCFLLALRHRPQYLFRPSVLRRLTATSIGRHRYELSKRIVALTSRSHNRN